ncbi:hypothetical protein D3C71_1074600 [compost metagenome]
MAWSTVSRMRSVCSFSARAVLVFWRISASRVSFHCQRSMAAMVAQAPSSTTALKTQATTKYISAGLLRQSDEWGFLGFLFM